MVFWRYNFTMNRHFMFERKLLTAVKPVDLHLNIYILSKSWIIRLGTADKLQDNYHEELTKQWEYLTQPGRREDYLSPSCITDDVQIVIWRATYLCVILIILLYYYTSNLHQREREIYKPQTIYRWSWRWSRFSLLRKQDNWQK